MKLQIWQKVLGILLILSSMHLSAITCGGGAKDYLKQHPDIFSNNHNDVIGKLYDPDEKVDAKSILNDTADDHYINIGAKASSCSPFDPPTECNTDLCCKAYYAGKKCPKDATQQATEEGLEASEEIPVIIHNVNPNSTGPTSDVIPDAMTPDL